MNAIMGFASLIPSEEEKTIIEQYSEIIMSNSELLMRIIDDIVLYSRLQTKCIPEEDKEFSPRELMASLKQSFELPEYQKKARLLIEDKTKENLKIKTDYEKLKQLLMNLTGNAFKYTPSGSIIIGADQQGESVIFSVKDTGIGIPKPEVDKIFERFFRGSNTHKETVPGTGLGLSIVKELVDLLNGEIRVDSEEGKGSAFYVTLRK
jgi:signal transduction histidine kinase